MALAIETESIIVVYDASSSTHVYNICTLYNVNLKSRNIARETEQYIAFSETIIKEYFTLDMEKFYELRSRCVLLKQQAQLHESRFFDIFRILKNNLSVV